MAVNDDLILQFADIANNSATRLPLILCVDASFSMRRKGRMKTINEGIRHLISDILNDIYAIDSVEMCIVSFGGTQEKVVCPFNNVTKIKFNDIVANGKSPLGHAVQYAIDRLEERVRMYSDIGISKYTPWLVILSDGEADDNYLEIAKKVRNKVSNDEIKIYPVCVGEKDEVLKEFNDIVYKLEEFRINDFFSWLSQSMSAQSRSTPGTDEEVSFENILK